MSPTLEQVEQLQDSLKAIREETSRLHNQQGTIESQIDRLETNGDNYRIEKDLLKETFSSNYLYLTMILAALGGVFTILTFTGFKDARATKNEFQRELAELRVQLTQSRLSAEEFDKRRMRFEAEHAGLLKKYELHGKRLEVVELLEKAQNHLIANGNAQFALEYATKALELAPERPDVLRLVASCLNQLNRSEEALKHLEQAYALQAEETIGDLLECRAFLNRFDGLEPLVEQHQSTLSRVNRLGGGLVFLAFRHYHNGNIEALLTLVDETINTPYNAKRTGKKFNWSVMEAIQVASHFEESDLQRLLLSFVGWCQGQVSHEDLSELVTILRSRI
jgi:tetratricopeptide (TPR) repeat protein